MTESILETIKKLVGIDKDYGVFDQDLIVAINSSFTILNQLGVGPLHAFYITGSEETWDDFFGDTRKVQLIKSYIYLRARLLFDPPSTGVLHEAIERQISEFEWRLSIEADRVIESEVEGGGDNSDANPDGISHATLSDRALPKQHPIEAITGLSEEVEKIPDIMTADQLRAILRN